MQRWGKSSFAGLMVALITMLAVGCGGSSGLSGSSSCKDFGGASPEQQVEVISKLATEYETPDLVTPLGEPNVAYACASEPDMTLDALFQNYQDNEAAEQEATADAGEEAEAEAAVEAVSDIEVLVGELPQEGLSIGEPEAPVTLVEFGDLQSPPGKERAEEFDAPLIDGPVTAGEAKLEYRNFIIISEQSITAAVAALAAGEQGRGWSFIELFYLNQGEEGSGYITPSFLRKIAEDAGVEDIATWEEELDNGELKKEVEEQTEEATTLDLVGVPSYAVEGPGTEGLELIGTPEDAADLERAITRAADPSASSEEVKLPDHLNFSPPRCPITVEEASQLMEEPMVVFGGMTGSLSCQFNAESGPDYLQIVWTEPESEDLRAEELASERSAAVESGLQPTTPPSLGARAVESRGTTEEGEFQDIIYWELGDRVIYVIAQGPSANETKVAEVATYLTHALE